MDIRFAEERDIPRIGELLLQVNEVHHVGRPDLFKTSSRKYSDAELSELLRDGERPILVAVNERGRVLGYVFCILERHGGNMTDITTMYIDDLCVDKSSRGKHIGTALYDAALSLARERGCYNVTLNVWDCNPSAAKFYEAMGLKVLKTGMEQIL